MNNHKQPRGYATVVVSIASGVNNLNFKKDLDEIGTKDNWFQTCEPLNSDKAILFNEIKTIHFQSRTQFKYKRYLLTSVRYWGALVKCELSAGFRIGLTLNPMALQYYSCGDILEITVIWPILLIHSVRVCTSIRPSVRASFRPTVRHYDLPFVRRSVRPFIFVVFRRPPSVRLLVPSSVPMYDWSSVCQCVPLYHHPSNRSHVRSTNLVIYK